MIEALVRSIELKKARLNRLRPLSAAALAQLQKHYDVELTYTSNAIEGNNLTLRETAEVIEHGITVGASSREASQDMRASIAGFRDGSRGRPRFFRTRPRSRR
jgi:Fic family protein